jgi:hypothetical protein
MIALAVAVVVAVAVAIALVCIAPHLDYKVDWKPKWHQYYPRTVRSVIQLIMTLTLSKAGADATQVWLFPASHIWKLPTEMLFAIFEALVASYRSDFVGYPTSIVPPEALELTL